MESDSIATFNSICYFLTEKSYKILCHKCDIQKVNAFLSFILVEFIIQLNQKINKNK